MRVIGLVVVLALGLFVGLREGPEMTRSVGIDHAAREAGSSKHRVHGGVPDTMGYYSGLAVLNNVLVAASR